MLATVVSVYAFTLLAIAPFNAGNTRQRGSREGRNKGIKWLVSLSLETKGKH